MRKVSVVLILLILIVAGGIYYLYTNLDSIVQSSLERGGTKATQATVKVDGVSIDLKAGHGSITGLSVGNPPGFSGDKALLLKAINLDVDTQRSKFAFGKPGLIVIKDLTVVDPVVTYEIGGRRSNMAALQRNVEAYTGASGRSSENDNGVRFIVDKLVIRGGEVKVQTKAGRLASSDIPTISRSHLGADSGGITGGELGRILVSALAESASKEVTTGSLKGLLDNPATGVIGNTGSGIKEGIKGLFGKD